MTRIAGTGDPEPTAGRRPCDFGLPNATELTVLALITILVFLITFLVAALAVLVAWLTVHHGEQPPEKTVRIEGAVHQHDRRFGQLLGRIDGSTLLQRTLEQANVNWSVGRSLC